MNTATDGGEENHDSTHNVHVALGDRSYDIHIGTECLGDIGSLLVTTQPLSHAVVLTDQNVTQYATTVAESLAEAGVNVDVLTVEAGEPSKSAACAATLWEELLAIGADRKSMVIAVGGGVVGDLAGFIAATFARGLAFVQIPTTLLAQVDSSVGGKNGDQFILGKEYGWSVLAAPNGPYRHPCPQDPP